MINYHFEQTDFKFNRRRLTNSWLKTVAEDHSRRIGDINVIFCSDEYLLGINRQWLGHDYYTDIITFDYCENDVLSGDLFISIDTVRANAAQYSGGCFEKELLRVMVHGVLHLVGYDDHTSAEEKEIHAREDHYLAIYPESQDNR